jgi:hypothetical protein
MRQTEVIKKEIIHDIENREYVANWELKPCKVTLNTGVNIDTLTLTQTDGWTKSSQNEYIQYFNNEINKS